MLSRRTFDDEMMNILLISPRPGLHHLLIDEVNVLLQEMADAFPEILSLVSIGKTGDGRDIPMIKVEAFDHFVRQNFRIKK